MGLVVFADTEIDYDQDRQQKIIYVDDTTLKQREMRDTIVLVQTYHKSGSGTIIDRIGTEDKDVFEYRVLTNSHVVRPIFFTQLGGVDSITGRLKTTTIGTKYSIVSFDHVDKIQKRYDANLVLEDTEYDLAILSFLSNKELAVAKIADTNMLEQVRVFDEVFAVGCQLTHPPSPTVGIISVVLKGVGNIPITFDGLQYNTIKKNYQQGWIIYGNTSQISTGSSGGGLFKKYDDNYYLIGIPYLTSFTSGSQFLPHLAYAISISTAKGFIDSTMVSHP